MNKIELSKYNIKELVKRVDAYLEHLKTGIMSKKERDMLTYHLDEKGIYQIIGGCLIIPGQDVDLRNELNPSFVQGRFIDAVVYAVMQDEFYANTTDPYDMTMHGRVIKFLGPDLIVVDDEQQKTIDSILGWTERPTKRKKLKQHTK